ncbi:merozoite surface protein CMZ-8-like [Gigantopelta aegis]|uniref:merozoite surface protein CMZ-8-like n=1 Tax=Gigantopelta aegis TaxID=1735272 RepID=UPI001B88D948|nr:merozoite surface protein CMZ-8-like [Gigantopelta aegis]
MNGKQIQCAIDCDSDLRSRISPTPISAPVTPTVPLAQSPTPISAPVTPTDPPSPPVILSPSTMAVLDPDTPSVHLSPEPQLTTTPSTTTFIPFPDSPSDPLLITPPVPYFMPLSPLFLSNDDSDEEIELFSLMRK